jgi:hypothetical protein
MIFAVLALDCTTLPAVNWNKSELDGTKRVEGRDCYRLKRSLKNGQTERAWIDA